MKRQGEQNGRSRARWRGVAILAAALLIDAAASRTHAVVLVDSASRNTTTPAGSASVPWNLEGQFANFLGTPIAPNLFVAARHIGGGGAG